jgi:hypothetical protein
MLHPLSLYRNIMMDVISNVKAEMESKKKEKMSEYATDKK